MVEPALYTLRSESVPTALIVINLKQYVGSGSPSPGSDQNKGYGSGSGSNPDTDASNYTIYTYFFQGFE